MKNNALFLLSVPLILSALNSASALTADEQLKATKEIFVSDFKKMDDNKDGKLSLEEYLAHQFENFRANIIEADGFDGDSKKEADKKATVPTDTKKETGNELKSLDDVNSALQEMADFDIDLDNDDLSLGEMDEPASQKLTLEDVLPASEASEKRNSNVETETAAVANDLDLSVSEEDNLNKLLTEINETPEEKAAKEAAAAAKIKEETEAKAVAEKAAADEAERNRQMLGMIDTIKKTLPKKIDEVTTWTDIEYKNKEIAYIYQADLDTSSLSAEKKTALGDSIKNEACAKAYKEMCPKLKSVFIDTGINVGIRYQDKKQNELGVCRFNQETCL